MPAFGSPSGTERSASMSSENATSRVGTASPTSKRKACRTIAVRATSAKVPMCGSPEGP